MDLIDNYLNTIRWNLPRGSKVDDIIAELRDVIASRIEEREDALDRPLDKSEISTLLRDFGHPLVVAARYGTQQYLIGPDLFPFYWFSLKIVLAVSAMIVVIAAIANAVFGQHSAIHALVEGIVGAKWSLLATGGLVTFIFAVIERTGWLTQYLGKWSPEKLPDLRGLNTKPKSPWESVFEVALGIAFLMWWVGLIHVPVVLTTTRGLRVLPDPVWAQFFWPIFALLAGRLGLSILQLLRPRWLGVHAAITALLAAAGLVVLAMLYHAGNWVTLVSATMPPEQLAKVQESLQLSLRITLVMIGLIWIGQTLGAAWRLYRARRG